MSFIRRFWGSVRNAVDIKTIAVLGIISSVLIALLGGGWRITVSGFNAIVFAAALAGPVEDG